MHAICFDQLKATNQLPAPTGVGLAILRLAESERTTAQDLAGVLQTDPALSGRVLKLANSASCGRGRPATTVREAVNYLGIRLVRNVALGFSLVSQYGKGTCRGFDYGGFWSCSLATAVAAQAVAAHCGGIAPAEGFTCGLLAQVGRLALASVYPDAYTEVLERGSRDPAALRTLERAQFATDHNELTQAMLSDWGLPELCVVAARHHECPEESGLVEAERALSLVRLLRLAAQMAAVCSAGEEGRAARAIDLFAAGEEIGLPGPILIDMSDRVVAEWQEWGGILQVATCPVPSFAELAQRARRAKEAGSDDVQAGEDERPLNIVVVDDDAVQLRMLSRHLEKSGHTVRAVADGAEALRLALGVNPHMVITDWQMPGLDGTALVKSLRQTRLGRQLYIIMLTGSADDDAQVAAFEAGADDFVVKPFCPRLLAARLHACSRVVRLQDEVRREREELRRCMADLGVANRKLQTAALTDALTGLYNRRYALERLDQEWARTSRSGQPLGCLMVDLDHFKRVNDTHGHDVGDRVLQLTAQVLRGGLRVYDTVCRLGGEEFVVIGPGMDSTTAVTCAERLRARVEAQRIEVPNGTLRVTMSVGVAVRQVAMRSPAELIKSADEAVYAAKAGGRNQVRLAAVCEATRCREECAKV
jgi:diguanylate cyclase (GGDEF)-like protein